MARKNLNTPPLFLWLALPPTPRQRNSKSKVSLWKRIRCFCPHYAGGIWKRWFFSEKVSNIFRQHCAVGIWNASTSRFVGVIVFESFVFNTNWKSAPFSNRPFYSCVLSYLAMNASEAGVELALIQTSLLFSCKCKLFSIRTTWFAQ